MQETSSETVDVLASSTTRMKSVSFGIVLKQSILKLDILPTIYVDVGRLLVPLVVGEFTVYKLHGFFYPQNLNAFCLVTTAFLRQVQKRIRDELSLRKFWGSYLKDKTNWSLVCCYVWFKEGITDIEKRTFGESEGTSFISQIISNHQSFSNELRIVCKIKGTSLIFRTIVFECAVEQIYWTTLSCSNDTSG